VGPTRQRGGGHCGVTFRVRRKWAAGWLSPLGRKVFPGVQFVFIRFASFLLFFFWISIWVLKRFYYSDLKEIKADHLWSFENVFRN
jgi:cellulose synthase/poly-beta-1,6-N-acetylglucosamine synthase-like glycosyltransferase